MSPALGATREIDSGALGIDDNRTSFGSPLTLKKKKAGDEEPSDRRAGFSGDYGRRCSSSNGRSCGSPFRNHGGESKRRAEKIEGELKDPNATNDGCIQRSL